MKKVALITNIPNQYRVPLFNELHRQLSDKNIDLLIIFGAATYKFRKTQIKESEFKFNYIFLDKGNKESKAKNKGLFYYPGLLSAVNKYQPDKIIVSGLSVATFKIWWKSHFDSRPYCIWSGSIDIKKRKIGAFKTWCRKLFVKRASSFYSYGSLAKKYLQELGAKEEDIVIIGNTVDVSFFKEEVVKLRKEHPVSKKKHLLYLGYIYPGKNIVPLIEIMERLTQIRQDVILDVVGDGVSRAEMENMVKNKGLNSYIKFHGFKQKEELPSYLARTTCMLFQTELDVWGLVLNEAMASKVTCFASINAGATEDIIIDGETGFKVDFQQTEQVTKKLNDILDQPQLLKRIGQNACELIESQYSLKVCAQKMISRL